MDSTIPPTPLPRFPSLSRPAMKRPTLNAACDRWWCKRGSHLRFSSSMTLHRPHPRHRGKLYRVRNCPLLPSIMTSSMFTFSTHPSRCRRDGPAKRMPWPPARLPRGASGCCLPTPIPSTSKALLPPRLPRPRSIARPALLFARADSDGVSPAVGHAADLWRAGSDSTVLAGSAIPRCRMPPPTVSTCLSVPRHIASSGALPRSLPSCSMTWPWPAVTSSRDKDSLPPWRRPGAHPHVQHLGRPSRGLDQESRPALPDARELARKRSQEFHRLLTSLLSRHRWTVFISRIRGFARTGFGR